jgi:hypothetical protein
MPLGYPACASVGFGDRGSAFRDGSAMHDDLRRDGELAEKGFKAVVDQKRSSRACDQMALPSASGPRTGVRMRDNGEEAAPSGGRLPKIPEGGVTSAAQAAAAPSR